MHAAVGAMEVMLAQAKKEREQVDARLMDSRQQRGVSWKNHATAGVVRGEEGQSFRGRSGQSSPGLLRGC